MTRNLFAILTLTTVLSPLSSNAIETGEFMPHPLSSQFLEEDIAYPTAEGISQLRLQIWRDGELGSNELLIRIVSDPTTPNEQVVVWEKARITSEKNQAHPFRPEYWWIERTYESSKRALDFDGRRIFVVVHSTFDYSLPLGGPSFEHMTIRFLELQEDGSQRFIASKSLTMYPPCVVVTKAKGRSHYEMIPGIPDKIILDNGMAMDSRLFHLHQ